MEGSCPLVLSRVILSHAFLQSLKPSLPFQQIPVLEVNGTTVISQSYAILRYCGTLSGLVPSDPLEAAKVDTILYALMESAPAARVVVLGSFEPPFYLLFLHVDTTQSTRCSRPRAPRPPAPTPRRRRRWRCAPRWRPGR